MITDNLPRLTAAFAPLLALLAAAPSLSQEARWFKVELMVFSQETQTRYGEEQWAPFPELAYPEQARFLIEPARIEANLQEYGGVSRIDQLGRQIIDLAQPENSQDIPYREDDRSGGPIESPGADATAGAAGSAAPEGFVVLPAAELEFAGKTAYMQRNGPYRILFHQAWLQPVADETDALPIIIDRSGDTEQWPRLQGSIKLHLSRYLHLETNLWLNTAGDYLPGQWRMPAPPLAPPSLIVEGLPEPEEEDPYFLTPAEEVASPGAGEETLEEPADAYPFRHAVLLRQKRRMRSEEVHYLDHPLLGAVVKVTPYEWDAGDGELPPAFPGASAGL